MFLELRENPHRSRICLLCLELADHADAKRVVRDAVSPTDLAPFHLSLLGGWRRPLQLVTDHDNRLAASQREHLALDRLRDRDDEGHPRPVECLRRVLPRWLRVVDDRNDVESCAPERLEFTHANQVREHRRSRAEASTSAAIDRILAGDACPSTDTTRQPRMPPAGYDGCTLWRRKSLDVTGVSCSRLTRSCTKRSAPPRLMLGRTVLRCSVSAKAGVTGWAAASKVAGTSGELKRPVTQRQEAELLVAQGETDGSPGPGGSCPAIAS